ncbi:MAG TPA: lactonase family protein [Devosiaceae bacterium]
MLAYVCNSDFTTGPDGGSPHDAVSVIDVDPATGAMKVVQTIGGLRNPSYLARNPKIPVLYVVERWVNPDRSLPSPEQMQGDCLTTFAIDPVDGTLSLLGRHPTGGESPMHLNVHPNGRFVLIVNPGRPEDRDPDHGHVTVIRVGDDGLPVEICTSLHYQGRPPLWRSRTKPYPHSIFADPQWRRIFVPILMVDRVMMYEFDQNSGTLTLNAQPYAQVNSGAGPRHLAFHPNGKRFYLLNSMDATIAVFSYNAEKGTAGIVQTISAHPRGFDGKRSTSHILVGPTGRNLYCTHRTDDSIAVFSIDETTGELTLIGHRKTLGKKPRDFVFDPSGRLMLVANQPSHMIASFFVDPATGDIEPTGQSLETFGANSIVFGAG